MFVFIFQECVLWSCGSFFNCIRQTLMLIMFVETNLNFPTSFAVQLLSLSLFELGGYSTQRPPKWKKLHILSLSYASDKLFHVKTSKKVLESAKGFKSVTTYSLANFPLNAWYISMTLIFILAQYFIMIVTCSANLGNMIVKGVVWIKDNTQILYFHRRRDIVLEEWNREIWCKRLSGGFLTYDDKFVFFLGLVLA